MLIIMIISACLLHQVNSYGNFCIYKPSCLYQVTSNISDNANCSSCLDEFTETPLRRYASKLGYLKLEPFMGHDVPRTVFKITLHNIKWNLFKMRFRQRNTNNCMVREINITSLDIVPQNNSLIYDCPWSNSQYENQTVDFEYAYADNIYEGKKTFVIHVPLHEGLKEFDTPDIQDLKLFTYVETTDLYALVLKILEAPKRFHIEYYEIYINQTINNKDILIGPIIISVAKSQFGVIDYIYDETYGVSGQYVFLVRPYNCSRCIFSESPSVFIPNSSTILSIAMVGVSVLLLVFLVIIYLWFSCNRYPRYASNVLIITTPFNDTHISVGKALALLLKENYNISVMIDVIDISNSDNMNPAVWINIAFKKATHVVFLIANNTPAELYLYRNMDSQVLTFMETEEAKYKKYCVIKFPYSVERPPMLLNYKMFSFPKDFNSFLNFIHVRGIFQKIDEKMLSDNLYNNLLKAIESVTENIKEPKTEVTYYSANEVDKKDCNIELNRSNKTDNDNSSDNETVSNEIKNNDDFNPQKYNLGGDYNNKSQDDHETDSNHSNDDDINELLMKTHIDQGTEN